MRAEDLFSLWHDGPGSRRSLRSEPGCSRVLPFTAEVGNPTSAAIGDTHSKHPPDTTIFSARDLLFARRRAPDLGRFAEPGACIGLAFAVEQRQWFRAAFSRQFFNGTVGSQAFQMSGRMALFGISKTSRTTSNRKVGNMNTFGKIAGATLAATMLAGRWGHHGRVLYQRRRTANNARWACTGGWGHRVLVRRDHRRVAAGLAGPPLQRACTVRTRTVLILWRLRLRLLPWPVLLRPALAISSPLVSGAKHP